MNLTVDITTSTLTVDVIVGNELTVDVTVYSQGGSDLTADELAGIQGANSLSALNPAATMADVGNGGVTIGQVVAITMALG